MSNLPLRASIAQSERQLFDDKYLAKDNANAELVCCVACSGYGYIELSAKGVNQCPSCECTGCLMDIQESDIKESLE